MGRGLRAGRLERRQRPSQAREGRGARIRRSALRADSPALLGASHARRGLPEPDSAATLVVFEGSCAAAAPLRLRNATRPRQLRPAQSSHEASGMPNPADPS